MSPKDAQLQALVAPIANDLAAMREVISAALSSDVPAVSDMTAHIGRFRGKQLRGALVLLCGFFGDIFAALIFCVGRPI